MGVLSGMEPQRVLYYFEEICAIPHGSGNTDKISQYLLEFAKQNKMWVKQDSLGNIIIKKPATIGREQEEPYILQGHMDMVAVKRPECTLNMEQDGLLLAVDGEELYARQTSLGGDDGIAVAYALALLESSDISHPALEVIITVDEEVGMEGAAGIDLSCLDGHRMINLDSEEEGIFLTSCAGGMRIESKFPIQFSKENGLQYEIIIDGSLGGHSGQEIHKGRANANIVLGKVLLVLYKLGLISIVSIDGGEKDNAIPNFAHAKVIIKSDKKEAFLKHFEDVGAHIKYEFRESDPMLCIHSRLSAENEAEDVVVFSKSSSEEILDFLTLQPNGVQGMSTKMEGLVETSLNMGVIKTSDRTFIGVQCLRSSDNEKLEQLGNEVMFMTKEIGGTSERHGVYPAWEYRENSELREHMLEVYERMYGHKPIVEAVHAGLECGLFAGKIEDLDCVSIGPDMKDIHTTNERLNLASVRRVWEYLLEVLR